MHLLARFERLCGARVEPPKYKPPPRRERLPKLIPTAIEHVCRVSTRDVCPCRFVASTPEEIAADWAFDEEPTIVAFAPGEDHGMFVHGRRPRPDPNHVPHPLGYAFEPENLLGLAKTEDCDFGEHAPNYKPTPGLLEAIPRPYPIRGSDSYYGRVGITWAIVGPVVGDSNEVPSSHWKRLLGRALPVGSTPSPGDVARITFAISPERECHRGHHRAGVKTIAVAYLTEADQLDFHHDTTRSLCRLEQFPFAAAVTCLNASSECKSERPFQVSPHPSRQRFAAFS